VIQQSLGQQVSQPVAQIVAGFAKVFVGEIVEKGMLARLIHIYIDD
jgi:transcription initiation factor TFIID subunit 11